MAKARDNGTKTLEAKAAAAQAVYDAAQSNVDGGESYAKNLEAEYREALANPKDYDRLTDLQAKRSAVSAVLTDLRAVHTVADSANDAANEELRYEMKLQKALEEVSPRARALVEAWKDGTLPSTVRLTTGQFSLPGLVGNYVSEMQRGGVLAIRRELENVAERVELGE